MEGRQAQRDGKKDRARERNEPGKCLRLHQFAPVRLVRRGV
jgi:hypothetical protein